MGLIAGKSGYAASLSVGINAGSDGPLTTSDYILLAIPIENLEGMNSYGDTITHASGGFSFSDRSGKKTKTLQLNQCQIDPQVQSTAMAELNAITDKIDEWNNVGADPIYFCVVVNSVNKTFRDSSGTLNKWLKAKVKSLRWKMLGPRLIEVSFALEDCES